MITTLRKKETENIYKKYRQGLKGDFCPLCERKGFKKFKYWKIMKNDFPYDMFASIHDMILPLRHITEDGLNKAELNELSMIKNKFIHKSDYNYIMEATHNTKSIPSHFHLHLIKIKQ